LQRSKRFNFPKGGALRDSIHTCNPLFNKRLEENSETGKEGRKKEKKNPGGKTIKIGLWSD
jgi:hypothetical protein